MERADKVMTRLTEELGLSLDRVRKIKIEPLRRIPDPPEIYQKWRALINGDEDNPEQLNKGKRILKRDSKDDEALKKVQEYEKKLIGILRHNLQWAEMALAVDEVEFEGIGMEPIEKVEVTEVNKPPVTKWMVIAGFEFWMDGDTRRGRKLYLPLDPENHKSDLLRYVKAEKKNGPTLMPGSGERGCPREYDDF